MERRSGRIVRQGRIYRFTVEGVEYAAFIWQDGSQFNGRIEDNPQAPQQRGRTALAVRNALSSWLIAANAKESVA